MPLIGVRGRGWTRLVAVAGLALLTCAATFVPARGARSRTLADRASASIREFVVPSDAPTALGPDGALWFTDVLGERVGRISRSGAVKDFRLPAGVSPEAITSGPDHSLWFTDVSGRIVRMTTTGRLTEFAIPGHRRSDDIVAGPDGALWFTEASTDRIGRMTTGGRFVIYRVLPSRRVVGPLVVGPDRAVWFGEYESGWIGRISTDGKVRRYRIPGLPSLSESGSNPGPYSITVGPDRALWFTDVNGLGRITTHGSQTAYRIAMPGLPMAGDLATGADGALWFTNDNGYPWVGRITTAGALSIVSLPNHLSLDRITAKPDGTIWAIANSADRIVAITTNMAAPDTPGRDATLSFGCRSPESRCTVAVDSLTATTTHLNALLIRRGTVCGSGSAHPSGPHAVVVIAPKHPIRRGGYELRVTISGAARTTTISLPERIG